MANLRQGDSGASYHPDNGRARRTCWGCYKRVSDCHDDPPGAPRRGQERKRSARASAKPGMTGSAVRVSAMVNVAGGEPARYTVTVRGPGSATQTRTTPAA